MTNTDAGYPERVSRSEEEEKLLKEIREEKERLWLEIQELRRQIIDVDNELAALDESNDEDMRAEKENQRVHRTGRNKFNDNPKEGIKFLQQQGKIGQSAEDVAKYLLKGEFLNKRAIGDYLGEGKEFNIDVLKKFIGLQDFTGKNIVGALRVFLASFHLPGEAQKIDRMMQFFANRYVECNPSGTLVNTDTCYILAYSTIMLNTSLHNPSVKDKLTIEKFISMNRGIDGGKDLPPDLLTDIYEDVKKEAFKIPGGNGVNEFAETFDNPEKTGWLTKEGGKYKSRHKRWFILKEGMLYYFKQSGDEELIGTIPLQLDLKVRPVEDPKAPPNCFEIYSETGVIKAWKKDSDKRAVPGNHDSYRLQAPSEDEQKEWILAINDAISTLNENDSVQQRKKRILSAVKGLDLPGME
ncbi:hypothetical protein EMCRGX_G028623 [Ephydatia muelleri]